MTGGGPPKEDVGPTQGWTGGPPEAPGPRTRADAGIQPAPASSPELAADEAQRDAEETARRSGERAASDEP